MSTRDIRRSRRAREVRARSVSVAELARDERERKALVSALLDSPKKRVAMQREPRRLPMLRSDCIDQPRPCPFVSCKHHLYLDITKSGALKLNFPDLEVHELAHSCVLDIADNGGATLEATGAMLNLTRERIRQLELKALANLEAACIAAGLRREDSMHEIDDRSVKP